MESYGHEFIKGLLDILKLCPNILNVLESISSWTKFASALVSQIKGISTILQPIIEQVSEEKISERRAIKLVLRTIPTITVNGYDQILFAISQCGQKSLEYVLKINLNFKEDYGI